LKKTFKPRIKNWFLKKNLKF